MPQIIPVANSLIDESESAVKLSRYFQILGISEDQGFGINNTATVKESCHPIWTLDERQRIARYLKEAQTEIEQVTHFPLAPRWIIDEFKYYGYPVHARWGKIIAAGFKNTSTILAAAVPSYVTDPCVVTAATALTDTSEIAVFHPGTTVEIYPSSVSIAGGTVTIQIPRARMVKRTSQDNDDNGLTYADVPPSATSPFEATVDIKRVYNDASTQGGLYWHHKESGTCDCQCDWCCATCSDYTENACIYIRNPETGALDLLSASYTNLVWTATCPVCYCSAPDSVRLNYKAGFELYNNGKLTDGAEQIEDAIIRLAHAKMPQPPCGCGVAQDYWARDRTIPENMSFEQAACPFGKSDGAWFSWRQANAMRYQRGYALG